MNDDGSSMIEVGVPRPVALLFDLDGTLLDHAAASDGALDEVFAARRGGATRDLEAFRRAWRDFRGRDRVAFSDWARSGRERVRAAFGRPDLDDDLAGRILAEYQEAYEARWSLFPDAVPCLERLRGRSLALVSNGQPQVQRRKLLRLGLRGRFREVLLAGEVGFPKPHPGLFLEAARRLRSLPGECVVVGDCRRRDVEGALNAGMQPVWLSRPGGEAGGAIPSIRSLSELPGIVDAWSVPKPPERLEADLAA
jgi:putative hydrolase of the HAD superfamily